MTARQSDRRQTSRGAISSRLRAFAGDDTGDVPGWVLVTLVTRS